jgi:hypothetical protein
MAGTQSPNETRTDSRAGEAQAWRESANAGASHRHRMDARGAPTGAQGRKTMMARLSRTLKRISMWCSAHRHLPIKEQHAALSRKLRGHDAYFGITG